MNPVDTLRSLEAAWPSTRINWEAVLSAQYRYACPTPRCVVDVGANLGAHVAQFVDMRCPRVVAFEPIPELAARLTAQYPNGPVTVHQVALADAPAEATYYIDREVLAESGLKGRVDRPDRIREELPVKVLTLDSFALADVDFIKIDAEGADLSVLGVPRSRSSDTGRSSRSSTAGRATTLTACRRTPCSTGRSDTPMACVICSVAK